MLGKMEARIIKLPDSTINLIAAGEIITRPLNVVKELMENAIDAGATNIRITIEQGGVRMIKISDNGHGIARFNAKLLCQRHATSKITSSDDLVRLSTFGFRGEALASISEMADVDVCSFNMTTDNMGWRASYTQGQVRGEIRDFYLQYPGTQIKVSNLFAVVKPRKNAHVASYSDERKNITDLVMKFAIHHRKNVTISLNDRTSPSAMNELVCSLAPSDIRPCLGSFHGLEVENNVVETTIKSSDPFKMDGYIAFSYKKSSVNIHQSNMILFTNNRLVECDELKREIASIALEFLNVKHFISIFYIALEVPPNDIDVNTHPAKTTVTLHYQQEIIALILTELRLKFKQHLSFQAIPNNSSQQKTIGELMKLVSPSSQAGSIRNSQSNSESDQRSRALDPLFSSQEFSSKNSTPVKRPFDQIHNDPLQPNLSQLKIPPSRVRRDMKLRSLCELRQQVASERSQENAKTIKNSIYVGIFDHNRALIQHETKLFAINFKAFLKEQCYQFYLFDFGNFPPIEILPPGNKIQFMISTCLSDLMKHEQKKYESLKFKTVQSIIDELVLHSDLYLDYLNLKFSRSEIHTLPCIVPDHVPNLAFLGQFLIDLVNLVDYEEEKTCIKQIGRVIAHFYSEPPYNLKDEKVHKRYHDLVETRLYEAIKRYLFAPEWLFTKQNMVQITDTKDLYKVFERC